MKIKLTLCLVIYLSLNTLALANIRIINPWVSASMGPNAALFMEIGNTKNKPDKLISAQAEIASHVEFHNHIDIGNGTLQMEKLNSIEIPASGYRVFKSGGYHIMLKGIHKPLRVGDTINFILKFENGETVRGIAPVKTTGPVD